METTEEVDPNILYPIRWEKMTAERVDELLAMNTHNRNPSETTVDAYARDMAAKKWSKTHQGLAVSSDGILIDGQQRLLAIKRSKSYDLWLPVTTGLPIATQRDVDGQRKRTARDVFALVCNTKVNVTVPAICRVLYKHMVGWKRGQVTVEELWGVYNVWADELDTVTHMGKFWERTPAPVLAAIVAALVVWPDRRQDINTFCWRSSSGAMLEQGTPELALYKYLAGKGEKGGEAGTKAHFYKTYSALYSSLSKSRLSRLVDSDKLGDSLGKAFRAAQQQ